MQTKQKVFLVLGILITTVVLCLGIFLLLKNSRPSNDIPRGTALEFNLSSVQKHSTPDNCWVSYNGQVYDLTRHLIAKDEPARASFTDICGKNIDVIPPSIKTMDMLSQYQIGILSL